MNESQVTFLLGMICGGHMVLVGNCIGILINRKKKLISKLNRAPVLKGSHWDCGVCGCSHNTYIDAKYCNHGVRK